MIDTLSEAGFRNLSFIDKTQTAGQWFRQLRQQREQQLQSQTAPDPLNPISILRPGMGPAIANFAQNILDDRLRVVQIIAAKP